MVNDPNVPPNLCFPGKAEVAEAVAELTGKKLAAVENLLASVRCSRTEGRDLKKETYVGHMSCAGARLAFGGPMACQYACIGLGDCASACSFDAIALVNGFPEVNPARCVACGSCVRACPKGIIHLIPTQARVWVPCSTQDPGKTVKEICGVGCISCGMCVKVCPAKAVAFKDDIVHIDHKVCLEYGPACGEVCVEKCPTGIFRRFHAARASAGFEQAAAA